MEGGRGGNATPEGTDQVQPRGASSNLPSGTRAQRSVLPGRGKAASTAQRRRKGQRAQGTQKEARRGTDRRGKKGRPGRPTRGSVGGQLAKVCVLHGYYPQARNPDSSRNSCWIWNSLSSTDGSTMPPHPRADGPHHSSAETSLPRKPSVPESISSGGFEPTTSDVSRDPAPYLTSRPTTKEGTS